jgi:hypothetical protein
MPESGQEKPRELTGKFLYFALLCSSPLLALFAYLGRTDQGFGAWACFTVVLLAMRNRWDLRKHVWFWIAIAFVVFIQVPIVFLIPWGAKGITGRGVFPVAIVDGALAYGLLKLAEMVIKRGRSTNSPT